jgi:uncharacterized repeat protein (TIGR01451 family)
MPATPSIRAFIAALIGVLLLACTGLAHAQAQVITNTANATYTSGGSDKATDSNPVITIVRSLTASIQTLHVVSGAGVPTSFAAPLCGSVALPPLGGKAPAGQLMTIEATTVIHAGEQIVVRLIAPAGNRNPTAIDTISAVVTASNGDSEVLTVFESAPDSGVFIGSIPTLTTRSTSGDCRLGLSGGDSISIGAMLSGGVRPIASATVTVLADPFGLVVDSEDGSPVDGVSVTLVDTQTGAAARVFADDGVTAWPATVATGQPVRDAAGNTYRMARGEYRFPLAPLGNYRLVVEPAAPYSAPSTATRAQLSSLTRPDGQPLLIVDGSFGGAFALASPSPVRIDVPIDRPGLAVALSKTASRARAVPGDAVFYTIAATNADGQHTKRAVSLVDTPSQWLRLRKDSIRIDGVASPAAVQITPDGSSLKIALGDIAPGGTRTVTYAMSVRADAPTGQALNRAVSTDARGNQAVASATLLIERETIASRMTLIGRITRGDCSLAGPREGIAGVRVVLEDGSFALTDKDGRYHFEGLIPGTHVAQAQATTLPGVGGSFIDCARSSRSAGSANSRFITGHGGSLVVADFAAIVGETSSAKSSEAMQNPVSDPVAAGAEIDWLRFGDGPDDFLFPALDHNPRAPAVRVAIRHRAGNTVELSVDGRPADRLAFDGAHPAASGAYAVSLWRGIPLEGETTRLVARIKDASGALVTTLTREVHFTATAARGEIVAATTRLVADGSTRPVLAVRVLDRHGRPVHAGISGEFALNAPYESAGALEALQSRQLAGQDRASPHWAVKGDDGIALIELAPTMVSGKLSVDFNFSDGEVRRRQTLETWVVPGDQKWTLVGLAEGALGSQTIADQMERKGHFDSDLGKNARVAFYAKGRVLGSVLLTVAYDSARDRADQHLLGTIDPSAYYTVFADGSDRRFDAASRNKLYVRIEARAFYALYGDFDTGFDQTRLARYQRTVTGVKAEGERGGVHAAAFAAKVASRHRRDEIQGSGLSGPYRLGSRAIIANSEVVSIERRDRFRSELVIDTRTLTRFIDYDIDQLSGTIRFSEPILSRDANLNPQFIVIDYEIDQLTGGKTNAGLRADYTTPGGAVRIGATAITDQGDGPRRDLLAADLKARLDASTEVRAELAASRTAGATSTAWLVEAEHHDGTFDVLAYARSLDADFGLGQQNGAERGRRKAGVDARVAITQDMSVTGSVWYDDSLSDSSYREAVQLRADYRHDKTDVHVAVARFSDRLAAGGRTVSTVLEAGGTQRLLDNRLELDATTSIALGKTGSIDLPARHRIGVRYKVLRDVKLIGTYEIANGDAIDARTARIGLEVSPWDGAKFVSTLGQQDIAEQGKRSFAAFGLAQSLPITSRLTVDASLDGNRVLGGFDASKVVNPDHPVASGGYLGEGGILSENFTAVTLGASYRAGLWSATARAEYRTAPSADRRGFTFGAIRQLGEGSVIGTGFTYTHASATGGAQTTVFDGAINAAHRPADGEFAFLAKLEYRMDEVIDAVADDLAPTGRTALVVTGDALSRRLIASLSTNWTPDGRDDGQHVQRSEFGLFLAVRHNFDTYQGFALQGTTLLAGIDVRIGLGDRFEFGGNATIRANLADHTHSFAFGPQIGFVPTRDMLLTLGYNFRGFRDRDFSAAGNTEEGVFASMKLKLDTDSLDFLGLGR